MIVAYFPKWDIHFQLTDCLTDRGNLNMTPFLPPLATLPVQCAKFAPFCLLPLTASPRADANAVTWTASTTEEPNHIQYRAGLKEYQ